MTQDPFYQPEAPTPAYTPEPASKGNNKTLIIVIVVVVVLLLCCCCAVASYYLWQNGDRIMYDLGLNLLNLLIR